MADLGLEVKPEWVLNCDWDDRKCIALVEKTYHEHGLPTAFYAASDLMAMAALRALYQLGIRVPDQVAVIGMSNIEMSQYANPAADNHRRSRGGDGDHRRPNYCRACPR